MRKPKFEAPERLEGFWKSSVERGYPMPRPRSSAWRGEAAFLIALSVVELEAKVRAYKGWSTCRICGKHNGTTTLALDGWAWPSGFSHYVEVHHVRPSLAFQQYIMARDAYENQK